MFVYDKKKMKCIMIDSFFVYRKYYYDEKDKMRNFGTNHRVIEGLGKCRNKRTPAHTIYMKNC